MVQMGWCPSGRLFEAAACGTVVLSDRWEGLSAFYTEGSEILLARSAEDVVAALCLGDAETSRIGRAARERTLAEHTSDQRANELLAALEAARERPNAKYRERVA
jgi:spore maturation protein CgeB